MAFRGHSHSNGGRGRGWAPRGGPMQGTQMHTNTAPAGRGRAQTLPAWLQNGNAAPAPGGAAAPASQVQPAPGSSNHAINPNHPPAAGLPPPPTYPPSHPGGMPGKMPAWNQPHPHHPPAHGMGVPPRPANHLGTMAGTNPQPTSGQHIISKAEQRAMQQATEQSAGALALPPPPAPTPAPFDPAAAEAAAAGVNPDNPWGEFMQGLDELSDDEGDSKAPKAIGAPVLHLAAAPAPAPTVAAPEPAGNGDDDDGDDDLFSDDDGDVVASTAAQPPPLSQQQPPPAVEQAFLPAAPAGPTGTTAAPHQYAQPSGQGDFQAHAATGHSAFPPSTHQPRPPQHLVNGYQGGHFLQQPPPGVPTVSAGPPRASLLGAPPGTRPPTGQPPHHPPHQGMPPSHFKMPHAPQVQPYTDHHGGQHGGVSSTGLPPPPSHAPASSLFSSFGSAPPPAAAPVASRAPPAAAPPAPMPRGGSLLHGLQPSSPATAAEVATSRNGGASGGGSSYPSHPPSEVFVVYAPQIEFNVKLVPLGRSSDPAAAVYPLPFDVAGRIDLAEKKTWWPSREGRLYFSAEPADSSIDGHAFKKAAKDLHKRNRAAVVKAGDHEHIWYFVPPKSELIAEGVVPKALKAQHKMLVVFGKHAARKAASKKRRRGE